MTAHVHQPPTFASLMRLAWPLVFSRMSQTVIGFSDTQLVSELGHDAIAATATGATNAFTLLILPMGVVFIVQSFAAQYFGRHELANARRFGWYGLAVAAVTQLVALASLSFIDDALGLFAYSASVRDLMTSYLRLRLLSGGAAIGIEALSSYYGGLGRTLPGMVTNIAAMVLNVVLNFVLIWGAGSIPAMGVAGSALASTIATWVMFLAFFAYFVIESRNVPRTPLRLAELGRMLRFGLPSGLNWFFEYLAWVFFINQVIGGLGTLPLAVWNVVILLNGAAFMPAFGMASAGAVMVGQAIGAGRPDDVPVVVKLTLWSTVVWQTLVGILYVALPHVLLWPFAKGADSAQFIELGSRMLLIAAGWQVFDATVNTLAEALRATGDTLYPLVARLGVCWALFVPGSLWAVRNLENKEAGAAMSLVVYLAVLSAILGARFLSGKWRTLRLVEPTLG